MTIGAFKGTALVTGGSGFLGAHVAAFLHHTGWNVAIAARESSNLWRVERLAPNTTFDRVHFDLQDEPSIQSAVDVCRPTLIVHCAAYGVNYGEQDLDIALRANVSAIASLIETSKVFGVERFVHVGTCYEYGDHPGAAQEDARLQPKGIYGVTKAAGTLLAIDRANALGVQLCVVRPFGIYGPFEGEHKFVPLVARACRGRTFLALTAGEQVRDYTYVGDIARAIAQLGVSATFPSGRIFNLASGMPMTIRAFGDAIALVASNGQPSPSPLNWGAKPYRPDEIFDVTGNPAAINDVVGWRATTPLKLGLEMTLGMRPIAMNDGEAT